MREMKDTNIGWIGSIPSDWNVLRIKDASWLKGRIGWDGLKSEEFIEEGPYLITGTDFDNGEINWDTCVHITNERYEEDELLHIKEGDLLITKDGTIGKLAIVNNCPEKVSLNSGVMIIRNNTSWKYHKKYMYYLLMSPVFWNWFEYNQKPSGTIKHLYQHQFGNFKFMLPPMDEQVAIAEYLDTENSQVDDSIARHKAIIEKLQEYRKAVITQAVTKGINPNVEMMDSGSEIIGSIPKSWSTTRLKFLCSITTGDSDTQDYEEDGAFPFYVRSPIIERSNHVTFEGEGILMAGDGVGAGRIFHHAFGKYAVHQRVYRLYDFNNIDTNFLFYYLEAIFPNRMDMGSAMSTVPSVRLPMLKDLMIALPSPEEQRKIANYITKLESNIDEAVSRQEQAIQKLEEYRKSVIYNAVTGKIDCRGNV